MNNHCINVKRYTKEKNIQLCQIGGQIDHHEHFYDKHPDLAKVNATLWKI